MSLTAANAQVYKGTAAVTYGSGPGVSEGKLQGTATVTYGGAPTSNTALVTGSSNYMKLPTSDPTNFDPSTSNVFVEAWVYWNGTNTWNSPNGGTIYERDNASVQDFGMYTNSSGQLTAYMYTQNGNILRPIYNTGLSIQTWYHVALGYNIANQTAYVWVNGNIGTTSTASNPARYTGSSIFTSIGASPLNGTSSYFWNGYIKDLRVIKGGNIPTTSFTPVDAIFRLNAPPYVTGGSTVLSLAEQYFTPSWLNLPGTSGSYMALGTTHPSNFDTSSTNFFVECWVYLKSIPAASTDYYIIQRGTSVFGAEDIGLRILATGYAEFYSYGTGGTIAIPNSGAALSAGTWYHLAGSIVSSTKTVYIFLNGVLKNSASMSGAPRTTVGSNFFIGTPTVVNDWVATNAYIQDLRVTRGGTVPTSTFTPAAAPFGLASPSYVAGGTTVLSLASQYYTTSTRVTSGGSIQMYSRPILPAVLVNPGNQSFTTSAGTFTVTQTALQPVNGITWTLAPTGSGVTIANSTDYSLRLAVGSSIPSVLFTITATNKSNLTSVIQIVVNNTITFHLAPTSTSSYSGNPPLFGPTYVTFTSASSQYMDWGTRTFNLGTIGFSAKMKISWTGYNNWSRVFDFNSGSSGNQDMFLTLPGTQNSPLRFMYKEGGAEQITDYNGVISLNTDYNITVVYNPSIGSTGRVQIWINGAVVVTNTGMALKGTDKSYTYTYVGKSSYSGDAYLGANIYFLDIYNRPLSDAEAAAIY